MANSSDIKDALAVYAQPLHKTSLGLTLNLE